MSLLILGGFIFVVTSGFSPKPNIPLGMELINSDEKEDILENENNDKTGFFLPSPKTFVQLRGGDLPTSKSRTTMTTTSPRTKRLSFLDKNSSIKGKDERKSQKFKLTVDFREPKVQIGLLASILFCYPILVL